MPRYRKVVSENRKAFFDHHILETVEAGIVLKGSEVKSVRKGSVNLKDSFARADKGEIWVHGMHISPYERAGAFSRTDPVRQRKLLLSKSQIKSLAGKVSQKGFSLIPLKMYFSGNYAKVEIGVAKGKKLFDKRDSIKKKDLDRDMERELSLRDKER